MNNPKITVYISSFNYGKYLQEAINSVLKQSADCWELLLINDNSSDNTDELMNLYSGDKRVKIFTTKGIGLPAVANLAVKHSQGEYIIRLDADDIFDENILLVLQNHMDRNPEVALVFPDYYLMDDAYGIIMHERRDALYDNNHVLDIPANGACTMIRKSVLEKIGGYREDLGAQDGFDIWTRITKEHKCSNINLPLFYYRRHGANLTENNQRILSARRTIKKDAISALLDSFRPIISVIPCRKNYDVYPDLWSLDIDGQTLLDIAIQTNIKSSLFDKIIITCDNEDVKKIIKKYDDKRLQFVLRDSKNTIPSSNIVPALENVVKQLGIGWNGISFLSYIQAPFTTVDTIEESISTLLLNDADSSFAVEEVECSLFKRSSNGLLPINHFGKFRSDFNVIYSDARTALATKNSNLRTGSITGSKIVNFVVHKDENFYIHSKKDIEILKLLWKLKK